MSSPKKLPEMCGIDMPLLAKMFGIKKIIVAIDNAKLTNLKRFLLQKIYAFLYLSHRYI